MFLVILNASRLFVDKAANKSSLGKAFCKKSKMTLMCKRIIESIPKIEFVAS